MPADAATVASLRRLLAERFPQAARPVGGVVPTGMPAADEAVGGLPRHALSELICAAPSAGGHLFLAQLLSSTRARSARVALIDSADQFDPCSIPPEELEHLVWVRCPRPTDALPVADLLVREDNFELVVLDLSALALPVLRRIPVATWQRLQRAAEQTDLAFLVLTPCALVPGARLRLQLGSSHGLGALELERPHLAVDLEVFVQRRRPLSSAADFAS